MSIRKWVVKFAREGDENVGRLFWTDTTNPNLIDLAQSLVLVNLSHLPPFSLEWMAGIMVVKAGEVSRTASKKEFEKFATLEPQATVPLPQNKVKTVRTSKITFQAHAERRSSRKLARESIRFSWLASNQKAAEKPNVTQNGHFKSEWKEFFAEDRKHNCCE